MRRSQAVTVLSVAVGLALVATACGSSSKTSGTQKSGGGGATTTAAPAASGGTLTQLIPSDPGNLDPLTTVTSTTRGLDTYAYDPLINLTPNGKLVSGLATKWTESGNDFTLRLKTGVTCSNGSPLTPATVAANINFLSNPKNKSPLLNLFVAPDAKATVSGTTLKIALPKPFPFFLQGLTQFGIVCAKGLAKPSSIAEATDGTGPYALTSAIPGQQYTFTARTDYDWGPNGATMKAAGTPAKIVVKVVSDATTAANELLQGEANVATVQGLASKPLQAAHLYSQSAVAPLGELWFNQASGRPTADPNVRAALVTALNLSQIGQVLGQNQGQAPTGLVTVTPKACTGNTVAGALPAFDASKAESMLDQDGWKVGSGGIRTKGGKQLALTLIYANDVGGDPASAFELASQELGKIGVKVSLVSDTTTALESIIFGTGSWDLVNVPLGINTPSEAVPFVSGPAAPAGENFAHIDNASYASLTATAAAKPGTTGCPEWNQAETDLFKATDVVPFENAGEPTWAKGATFTFSAGEINPTSLRLVKS